MSTGILLVNLGSPDSTSVPDVRRYLAEFLMDERVIDAPWLIRFLIVYAGILPKRPAATAALYQRIWTEEGSPLIVTSQRFRDEVQSHIQAPVALGMRYGKPSIRQGLQDLMQRTQGQLQKVILLPLYPHYAMSSFETVVEKCKQELSKISSQIQLEVIPPFFKEPQYLSALASSMRPFLTHDVDHLLFSYHGIPERHLRKSDPTKQHCLKESQCCEMPSVSHATCYRHQCFETTRQVTTLLGMDRSRYSISFQSRLGKDPWLKPYTDFHIADLAKSGVQHLAVVCPAFVSDCLETLEEIQDQARHIFLENGGKKFTYIPCLNISPDWIDTTVSWLQKRLS